MHQSLRVGEMYTPLFREVKIEERTSSFSNYMIFLKNDTHRLHFEKRRITKKMIEKRGK